ncbi:MAG: copy number control protein [Cyanobacteria bacterium]|nr:copy number control protein [Cyanobacteriota bacterium]MDA0867470.1 copy number control protein [Cyanobacteriota bacterium]
MAKTVAIRVQMPDTLRAKFKAQCVLEEKTMSEMVIALIEQYLAQQ